MHTQRGLLVAGLLLAISAVPAAGASPAPMPSPAPLPASQVVEGSLMTPEEQRTFAILMPRLGHLDVTVRALDPILDPVLEVYGPDGTWLGSDDDSAGWLDPWVTIDEPGAGCYVLLVRSAGAASTGRFRLVIDFPATGYLGASEACAVPAAEVSPAP